MKRRNLIVLAAALTASTAMPAFAQDAAKPYAGTRLAVLMEGHPTTDGIQALLPGRSRILISLPCRSERRTVELGQTANSGRQQTTNGWVPVDCPEHPYVRQSATRDGDCAASTSARRHLVRNGGGCR